MIARGERKLRLKQEGRKQDALSELLPDIKAMVGEDTLVDRFLLFCGVTAFFILSPGSGKVLVNYVCI